MSNVIRLAFSEPATAVLPSDSEGNVLDFTGDTGATPDLELPDVVDGLTGYARQFASNKGGTADDVDSAALLEKDLSVQCLIKIDATTQDGLGVGVVIANDAAWQFQIEILDLSTSLAKMRLGWSAVSQADPDIAGDVGTLFTVPDDGYLMLTATRHWVSSSEVRVRYYVNDVFLEELTSAYGDVDGSASDPVTIGCRPNGANYEYFLAADVDGILVTDHEMSFEEIRQTFHRIAIHQPDGRLMLQPMLAAGKAYSLDPDSGVQLEVAIEGDGLGMFYSKNQELREDYIPDRAWSMLEDWERVCRLPPKGLDTFEVRRNRIVSYLRTAHGYAEPDIQTALADVLDLSAASIQILNYTNRYTDDFATALADYWTTIAPNGSVSISGGACRLQLDAGADGRWGSRSDTEGPTMIRLPIDGDIRDSDPSDGVDIQVKISSDLTSNFDVGDKVGLYAYNVAGDLLFLGFFRTGSTTFDLGWQKYTDGVLGSWNILSGSTIPPYYIRLRFDGSTTWTYFYHASDPDDVSNTGSITGISLPTNVGVMIMQDVASNPSNTIVDVDDWRAYMPNGLRVFSWWAYANPSLGGSPDLDGARAIIERMKPADSKGGATTVEYIQCGDSDHGCGEAPVK